MKAEWLAALHAACFTTPRPWRADEFVQFLTDSTCDLVTNPGGFALIRSIAGEAELLTIAVDPDLRRKGIATDLLSDAIRQAKSRAADLMFLEVSATNAAAIALYQNAGFTRTGLRPKYYHCPDGTRTDAVLMALKV